MAGGTAFPNYKNGWLSEELPDAAKLLLLSAADREVLTALAALLEAALPLQDYGVIKELLRAHATHARLGNEAHVRRILERIRARLGMKSIAAARWYARTTAGVGR